jgi:hypothetical protein
MEECGNCRYWKQERFNLGECRRRAPISSNQIATHTAEMVGLIADAALKIAEIDWPSDTPAEPTETTNAAMFPKVYLDDWCGEFERSRTKSQ